MRSNGEPAWASTLVTGRQYSPRKGAVLVDKDKVFAGFWSIGVFLGSLFLFPLYTGGDQLFYREFYAGIEGLSIGEAWRFYRDSLGTSEPGYFILVYFFGQYIPKDFFIASLNGVLTYFLFLWALRTGVSHLVLALFVFNFYFLVLVFSAERLKISFLTMAVGAYVGERLKLALWGVSLFAHVQSAMLIMSLQAARIARITKKFFLGKIGNDFVILAVLSLVSGVALALLFGHVSHKVEYYHAIWGGWDATLKPFVFMGLAAYCAKGRRFEAMVAFAPIVAAAYFVGSERTVMLAYAVFMYYGIRYRNGLNFPVFLTSCYFGIKGGMFLVNIIRAGDGFVAELAMEKLPEVVPWLVG